VRDTVQRRGQPTVRWAALHRRSQRHAFRGRALSWQVRLVLVVTNTGPNAESTCTAARYRTYHLHRSPRGPFEEARTGSGQHLVAVASWILMPFV
jgi:hypothetical protein